MDSGGGGTYSLTDCNSGTTQKLPFGVNSTVELKSIIITTENTSTRFSQNVPR